MTTPTTTDTDKPTLKAADFDWDSGYTEQVATYREFRIEVIQDQDPINPRRDYDPFGSMVCFHRRYDLGDANHDLRSEDFDGWADMARYIEKELDGRVIIPLYLIDHSGISMRAGRDFRDCDPGGWDSGQVGFIFATADQIRECFMKKRVTKDLLVKAEANLRAEVETYDSYLQGDCYGFRVIDTDGDEVEDGSCWGFLGDLNESGLIEEAKSVADWHADKRDAARVAEDFQAMAEADPMRMVMA